MRTFSQIFVVFSEKLNFKINICNRNLRVGLSKKELEKPFTKVEEMI